MAARAIGTGTISFGLVSIPVKLYTATASEAVSFNLIHKKCKGRIKQQIFCPTDNELVERTDLLKGYEYAKNQYVLFTEEELDALEAAKTNSLEIVEFVPAETVDWIYISKTYYLGPDKGGDKAYKLLSSAMERTQKIAVGRLPAGRAHTASAASRPAVADNDFVSMMRRSVSPWCSASAAPAPACRSATCLMLNGPPTNAIRRWPPCAK